jgi:PhnB protein
MKPTLSPYLIFNGQAVEAMKFYQGILGGELAMQTFGEAKAAKEPADKNRTIHAALKNDSLTFFSSDAPSSMDVKFGENVKLSIMGTDEKKLTGFFQELSAGGKIEMPLAKQFWGDTFGMFIDRFGVHWMVDIPAQPPK